jgi:hypothetical protein
VNDQVLARQASPMLPDVVVVSYIGYRICMLNQPESLIGWCNFCISTNYYCIIHVCMIVKLHTHSVSKYKSIMYLDIF